MLRLQTGVPCLGSVLALSFSLSRFVCACVCVSRMLDLTVFRQRKVNKQNSPQQVTTMRLLLLLLLLKSTAYRSVGVGTIIYYLLSPRVPQKQQQNSARHTAY